MRGEHTISGRPRFGPGGSSPHARGTQEVLAVGAVAFGIIPACAGNTDIVDLLACWRRDHPRMRGEHRSVPPAGVRSSGSSPHARGTQAPAALVAGRVGIIPACAGNTPVIKTGGIWQWDHPRMRGEHRQGVWGCRISRGIIPACAGNTRHGISGIPWTRDHPRMRGEHV